MGLNLDGEKGVRAGTICVSGTRGLCAEEELAIANR
jgi:hypothetical protein